MTHTAGFEEQVKDHHVTDENVHSLRHASEAMGAAPCLCARERRRLTPTMGASLAGYIVQRVSGEHFDQYVARHIFAPLGMTRSSFRQPLPANLKPLMSKGYSPGSDKPIGFEFVGPLLPEALPPAVTDMGRFMIAHLQNGAGILQPETAQLMHSTANVPIPGLNGMALGFYQHNVNGHRVIAHGGDTNAFHSDLHLFIDDGRACTYRSTAAARKAQRRRFARRSSISSRIATSPLLQPRSPRSTPRPLGPMRSCSLAAGAARAAPSLASSRSPTCLGRPKSAWIKTERCTPRWRKFSAFARSNGFRLDRCCGATPTVTKCSARKS